MEGAAKLEMAGGDGLNGRRQRARPAAEAATLGATNDELALRVAATQVCGCAGCPAVAA
jgi:hypothetical protein